MKKWLRIPIAILLITGIIYMGYFFNQECRHKYPEWLPPHMYEIYDVVYSIDVKYVPEIRGMDIWQWPEDTERVGGDCEDWAIVTGKKLADLFYNIEPVSGIIKTWGGSTKHMWVRVYIKTGNAAWDAWDIDLTVEPRMFPARLPHSLDKKGIDKFWQMVLKEK